MDPRTVELHVNARVAPRDEPYARNHDAILATADFEAAYAQIQHWPGYRRTPLFSLPARAQALGIGSLSYKDESRRFGLGSFKGLGGAYAVALVLLRELKRQGAVAEPTIDALLAGSYRDLVANITITSATDGNHGRAVAWGASKCGCRAVIFIHEAVSEGRRAAIAAYGAEVVRLAGGYDDSVRHAFATASANGWHVVQDTATADYRQAPADITCGYGVLAREIVDEISAPPTHVFVQAGVGGVASAVCAVFWQKWGAQRPRFIVFEPSNADCVLRSIAAGRPEVVPGDANSFMAGLSCGEISLIAWDILRDGADAVISIDDDFARDGMRALAAPLGDDPVIVGGECSGGALGTLLALADRPEMMRALGIDRSSRVLLIGTEGATDPDIYREVVGRSAADVEAQSRSRLP
jgi:diaminopropionate ammonia-lyase